ncbi:unnamed protein product [Schistocephalus solidus]|uniref:RWD domain-containing protein n=1 Tax=Schistocephalus solidus TaxID=70667 RepID=A0A183TNL6_SCHSO|nr:unnamed protein product [Schistocephalus solidus]
MSTAAEDQENEVEVLASIYEENFQRKSSTTPYDFEIHLRGHAPEAGISCFLYFRYSKNYPNEAPIFEVRRPVGLTENQTSELVMLISDIIQRSLGGIMIFDLVSEVQIKLDEYSDAALERAKQFEMQTAKALTLAEEEKRFHGTHVTVESFNQWNKAFIAEVQEKRALLEKKATPAQGSVKRLTGREMFLRDDKFDESDLTFLEAEGGEIVEVDERLFVDIDDVDFEDEDLDRPVIAT